MTCLRHLQNFMCREAGQQLREQIVLPPAGGQALASIPLLWNRVLS